MHAGAPEALQLEVLVQAGEQVAGAQPLVLHQRAALDAAHQLRTGG
jgi:hypothetical protein